MGSGRVFITGHAPEALTVASSRGSAVLCDGAQVYRARSGGRDLK